MELNLPLIVLCVSFTVLLVINVPVAFAIAVSCILTYWAEGLPFATGFQSMIAGMNVFSFLAIPFFIFSGELMLHGGIAEKIVAFARNLVGHWRGGLGMANVVACTLFGGVSGSPVADVSAMGGVMIPMMRREGYSADYAVNVTTHASLAGALMPTSHNMIIYAFAAQGASGMIDGYSIRGASIGDLMFAGLLPVTCLMICMLVAAYWVAVKNGFPKGEHGAKITPFPGWHAILVSFVAALPGLFVVVLILGCILAGASTATEAAGIAVTYSMILTVLIYRTLGWSKLMLAAAKAAKTTGVVLLLIGVCNMLQWQMAYLDLPEQMANLLLAATDNPWMMFFFVNVILFILGTFMDMASTILICTPLFLPLCIQMGMGPVQFGIVILVNAALGLNTPPVGPTQFVGCAIAGISIDEVMKTILPFYGALFACLAVVTYVPWFSTWIPTLLKGQPVF